MNVLDRFYNKVLTIDDGCSIWIGAKTSEGYGRFNVDSKYVLPHRFIFEQHFGKIKKGLQIDHLCNNPSCVKLDHLEVVTPKENNKRSDSIAQRNSRKTHCPKGHEYNIKNTYFDGVGRRCIKCNISQGRKLKLKGVN